MNLFANPAAEDIKKIVDLADRSIRLGQDSPGLCWLQLTRGMASYRAGDLASSANWLRRAEGSGLDDLSRAVSRFYVAMVEHRLGHSEQARALFQQASQMLDAATGPRDSGARWSSVVETVLSRREAEALILRAQVESAGRDSRDARSNKSIRERTSPDARP